MSLDKKISMKKIIILTIYVFFALRCYSHQFDVYFDINFGNKISFKDSHRTLYQNINDSYQFFFHETEIVCYADDKVYMTIDAFIDRQKSEMLYKLICNKMLDINNASSSLYWQTPLKFIEKKDILVEEYLRDVGNGWSSDDFGFIIHFNNSKSDIAKLDVKFLNIYSIYIDKGGYTSPWNREKVTNYKNQNNPGIQLYYLVEEAMKNIKVKQPLIQISGILNDDKVRFRKEANLSCETIKLLNKSECLEILDVSEKTETIGEDSYPWIYVKDDNGKTGYVYGKYLDVKVDLK